MRKPSGVWTLVLLLLAVIWPGVAAAQSTSTYSNTTTGAVNSTRPCTTPLVRNVSVTGNFTIGDLNVGILTTHTWRGDLQFTLQSPSGTRVQLTNGDTTNVNGDNFNVLLDDAATQVVNTDSPTANHSTTAPPYQNTFRPRNPLSAFNGQSANGTWTLEICDLFPSEDDGSFRRVDLYFTSVPPTYADLSLTKTLVGSAPTSGGSVTWRLSVTNAGSSTATASSVTVRDNLPVGFVFGSATGTGTFNATTGTWTVGSIAAGQTRTIDITGTMNASAGATVTNTAEITASSVTDLDSIPNNGVTSEDDYASSTFVVAGSRTAGQPPTLSCPNQQVMFDWDTIAWTSGATTGSYPLSGLGNIGFVLTNPGAWLNNASVGGQSPTRQNVVHAGTNQFSLLQLVDMANTTDVVTTTITLPARMQGAQFRVFDVDFGANQFADRIEVIGRLNGVTVMPTLTNGVANYVIGNTAYGDGPSNNDSADGTIYVTFSQPVDTIIVRYGNYSAAPANPGQQGIALHDFTFCRPDTNLAVGKSSTILSDPVNGTSNPKAIPGAVVDYLITVQNIGISPTDNNTVSIVDFGPADAKMCFDAAGSGQPVAFVQGAPSSGLTYSYVALTNSGDHLEFSSNGGTTWTYQPTADADNCDAAITHFRIRPTGSFAPGSSFTLRTRYIIE